MPIPKHKASLLHGYLMLENVAGYYHVKWIDIKPGKICYNVLEVMEVWNIIATESIKSLIGNFTNIFAGKIRHKCDNPYDGKYSLLSFFNNKKRKKKDFVKHC